MPRHPTNPTPFGGPQSPRSVIAASVATDGELGAVATLAAFDLAERAGREDHPEARLAEIDMGAALLQ